MDAKELEVLAFNEMSAIEKARGYVLPVKGRVSDLGGGDVAFLATWFDPLTESDLVLEVRDGGNTISLRDHDGDGHDLFSDPYGVLVDTLSDPEYSAERCWSAAIGSGLVDMLEIILRVEKAYRDRFELLKRIRDGEETDVPCGLGN